MQEQVKDKADATGATAMPVPERENSRWTESGEGVISTAIAVLVIAFLGVAMWVGFQAIFDDASQSTRDQVELIGR